MFYVVLTITQKSRYYYSHFIDEENDAKKNEITYLRSPSRI